MLLFLIKIASGIIYGYIVQYTGGSSDALDLNHNGMEEYKMLFSHPKVFFTDIFISNYGEHYGSFFGSHNSYWNDFKYNFISKLLAFTNIFSHGNYYINSLFFNIACFFSHVALYRVFINIYSRKKWLVVIGCFLLPTTLFFSSGLDKDCIAFTMLGIFCYAIFFSFENRFNLKKTLAIIISFTVLLLIRNYMAIAMIPGIAAWIIANKYKKNPRVTFSFVFILLFFSLLIVQTIQPEPGALKLIVQKQQDFFALEKANSQLQMDTLHPNVKSFFEATPRAVNHAIMRPYIGEFSSIFYNYVAIEFLIYEFIFLILLFFYQKREHSNPFIVFCIFYSVTLLLFIGYIVPNAGALIRYKSIYLPLMITPMICSINWEKLKPI